MNKKTAQRLIIVIISFIAIILLQFAFSSPGAAAQTEPLKEPVPLTLTTGQEGTPGVQPLPAGVPEFAVTGEPGPGDDPAAPGGPDPQHPGWHDIVIEGFEGAWPASGWSLYDYSNDGYERLWGDDNYRSFGGNWSAWPVSGGADGGDASVYLTYPNDTNSWMIYGPFDMSDASAGELQFQLWREIEADYDWLFAGVSGNGTNFEGYFYWGNQDWTEYIIDFSDSNFGTDYVGDSSVYVAFQFYSDSSVYFGGPFVDDIVVRKYLPAPTADFSGTPRSGTKPLTVNFTDLSQYTGSISSWAWNFGDGGSSTQKNPSHTYNTAGSYTVSLTVTDQNGTDSETKTNYISVADPAQPPTAEFSGTPTSGATPLTVNFTNLSTGDVNSYSWNFGDGGSSTQANPSHTYTTPGNYTVALTVSGPGGSNTNTKNNYISVTAPVPAPVAEFSGTPTSGASPLAVNFTNLSTGNITQLRLGLWRRRQQYAGQSQPYLYRGRQLHRRAYGQRPRRQQHEHEK